jgi:hypothetical protein
MGRNRSEYARYRVLSDRYGLDEQEVRKIVCSFFDTVLSDARGLPFDNPKKIYTKDKFEEYVRVRQIPYVGRLGPVYSRYLKWRANMSEQLIMAPRSAYRKGITQSELETMAAAILSGAAPPLLTKRKKSEMFDRVWLVGQEGKKSARQVIPKEKK